MADEQRDLLIEQLTKALKESRSGTDKQLEEVSKMLNQLVPKIESLQRDVIMLQADMKTQFVPRVEYEPRHLMVTEKLKQYDEMIVAAQPTRDRFVRMEEALKTVEGRQDKLELNIFDVDKRLRGLGQRVVPWIAVVLTAIGWFLTFLSHISIK